MNIEKRCSIPLFSICQYSNTELTRIGVFAQGQYAIFFFTKWLPAAILDDRSHFSPFQINTQFLLFCSQNGCRRPFWMTENHFRLHFLPFQINTQLLFFSQNGCRRPFWMTENHFRLHFLPFQINTQLLFFSQNGCRRPFG